jgi:hypothetical protein
MLRLKESSGAKTALKYSLLPESTSTSPCYLSIVLWANSFYFSRHRKTHTLPYRCDCGKGFGLRTDLNRHKATHGSVDTRLYCKWPSCTFKGTLRGDNLRRHMRTAHDWQETKKPQEEQDKSQGLYKESLKEQKHSMGTSRLVRAAYKGNNSVVALLLENGVDVMEKSDLGQTALHAAAIHGNENLVHLLLKAGIDSTAKNNHGRTALQDAAKNGHVAVVRILAQRGVNFMNKNEENDTSLHDAATFGHYAVVQLLLEHKVDIDAKDGNGKTALYQAAANGYEEVVSLLLEHRADINGNGREGKTALQAAV